MRARFRRGAWDGLGLTASLAAVGLAFWGFAEVTELWVGRDSLSALDAAGERLALRAASPALSAVMHALTWLGSGWAAGAIVAGVAFWMQRRRAWRPLAVLLVGFGAGQALVYGLKALFARARPAGGLSALGAGFPSGHSFTATLTFGLLAWLLLRGGLLGRLRPAYRALLAALLLLLAALVGLSRIYLRAHYATDVLGGAALALGWLAAAVALTRWLLRDAPPSNAA